MAEQALDGVQIGSSFQQMRREGVTKRVDPSLLGDPRPLLGTHVEALGARDADGTGDATGGKQPGEGAIDLPVAPEFLEEPLGQEGVAILRALALVHANRHAIRVDVRDLEVDDFADPEPRGVGRHEQGPVLGVVGRVEQPADLLLAQDLRQLGRLFRGRDAELRTIALERLVVQEAQSVEHDVAATPRQLPLHSQVE